jgi:hypothetical protein
MKHPFTFREGNSPMQFMLFHVSEESGIVRFDPRPSKYVSGNVVWAINSERLCNYLLPRECPRVTFYAGPQTSEADSERFLPASSRAVVAVESGWIERVQSCRLYCYQMPAESFESFDECAGYYLSREVVEPERVEVFDDVVSELARQGVELRILPSLWSLRDEVVSSSLQFSLIRMHNALPREAAWKRVGSNRRLQ